MVKRKALAAEKRNTKGANRKQRKASNHRNEKLYKWSSEKMESALREYIEQAKNQQANGFQSENYQRRGMFQTRPFVQELLAAVTITVEVLVVHVF
jgi:hypothetical protein